MKKKVFIAVCALFLMVIGVVAYFEIHFPSYEIKEVTLSDERILKEAPDIALTDADMAFGNEMLSDPEVLKMMGSDEVVPFSDALAERLTEAYLPEGTQRLSCFAYGNTVYVDYFAAPEKRVILTFSMDDAFGVQKTIGLYRSEEDDMECEAVYENLNGGDLRKYGMTHRWFAWLTDHMWEE